MEVDRGNFPTVEAEVPAQVRRRFQEQLEREKTEDLRNWLKAIIAGILLFVPVLYLLYKAIELFNFWES